MAVGKMTVDKKVLEEMPWYHFIAFNEESLINILQARAWLNVIKRFYVRNLLSLHTVFVPGKPFQPLFNV
jgi:hypothetical protein